jgi:hypothetical protein
MGNTVKGLPNNGATQHYRIEYDDALPGALSLAQGLQASCEVDFALMQSWFGGFDLIAGYPIRVHIANAWGGAEWPNPVLGLGYDVTLKPKFSPKPLPTDPPPTVALLRSLLVAEVTEMFMQTQSAGMGGGGWFQGDDEGSKGEGLSRFLAVQFQIASNLGSTPQVPQAGYAVTEGWLNGQRKNYIDSAPDDNKPEPDQTNGCTTAFIYYLHDQLGFTIGQIIAAAASTLSGVYRKLTGRSDAWESFINLVNSHYPPGMPYNPVGDNLFPVSDLSLLDPPDGEITTGYDKPIEILVNNPAMAEVHINLTSDDPSVLTVPQSVTINPGLPVGGTSATFTLTALKLAIPFPPKFVTVHADYAGKRLQMTIEVVPPRIASVTLASNSVVCGNSTTGTVTLARPTLSGPVSINVISSSPGFATIAASPVTIPTGGQTANFTVNTPNIEIPFSTARSVIVASYAGSSASATLMVNPKIRAGILASLSLLPATIPGGDTVRGMVTLEEAVDSDTVVGLAAIDGGVLPRPGAGSSVASVQSPTVTIPKTRTSTEFAIRTERLPARESRAVTIVAGAVVTKYARLTVTGN